MPTTFRVFYSWQSDSDRTTNKDLILKALEAAASTLAGSESRPDLKVYIDEATRDEAGSPNIPETILKKIAVCDAFVCDVTTINPESAGRKVPNPNVVYELGYAVAMFGWQRVILLFNEEIGSFPIDLPFDFDRHRAKNYRAVPATSKESKSALEGVRKVLAHFFVDSLGIIIDSSPKPPDWRVDVPPDETKRRRDIQTLRLLLRDLPIDEIDRHIENVPIKIAMSIFHFWEGFHANWKATLTHVYDQELQTVLGEIHNSWEETLAYPEFFRDSNYAYYMWSGQPWDEKAKHAQDTIYQSSLRLNAAVRKLSQLVHEKYIEIDLNETSRAAWNDYITFSREPFAAADEGSKKPTA